MNNIDKVMERSNTIRSTLRNLLDYYRKTSRSDGFLPVGHTTLMREGTDNNDCIVIYDSMETAHSFGDRRGIGIRDLHKLVGQRKPLAIDHFALQIIFEQALDEIRRLEDEIENPNVILTEDGT